MNLRIFDTAADAVTALARTLLQRASAQDEITIAISGGSTPKPLYELLGRDPRIRECAVTWVVVDERYVPSTDDQSNAKMLRETLFRDGVPPKHRFLDFKTDFGEPEKTVEQFETEWRAFGIGTLDLILLGIGDDGHTASLFPETPVLDVTDRIAAAVYVPRLEQWRVTVTLPVIQAAKTRIVLVAGESKAPIVADVARGVDHPITRAVAGAGETWWFLDRPAAGQLSQT